MPDLNKLKGIMVENGKTYVDGARVIGCSDYFIFCENEREE